MHRLVRGAVFLVAIMTAIHGTAHPQSSDPATAPLRSGDRLLVKVWLDTILADTVRIDETGTAILPRLGPFVVGNMQPSIIGDSVRRAYSRIVRTPAIEVTALRRVTVLGEVRKPATYYMETHSTLREAVALAGGITEIGALGSLTVIRDSVRIEFHEWERRGDAAAVIHSGDVLLIDREPWLKRNLLSVISGLGVLFSVLYTATR
ncbi:MAG: SLBB domain-containing protein [Gemmatimonadaceae bacterium]